MLTTKAPPRLVRALAQAPAQFPARAFSAAGDRAGVGAVRTVGTHYFDWHHSRADTVDKVKLEDLRANIAAMAVMAYTLADMPAPLRQVTSSTR